MAAPRDKTVHDLNGHWKFNHALSGDIRAAMAIQGVNVFVRTALSRAPISLTITQTRDDVTGIETLITKQNTIGRTMEEQRPLNWEEIATSHIVFGDVRTKARVSALGEIANALLLEDWQDDTQELIEVQSQGPDWTSWQAWGFEIIDGTRYHVRRAVLQKGDQFVDIAEEHVVLRMVYDWVEV